MSNRHSRRADLKFYRGLARGGLITWLVDINDPLHGAPLLRRARNWWLALPASPTRTCLVCKVEFLSRDDVGALLLTTPSLNASSAGAIGMCRTCWGTADQPAVSIEAIEAAGTKVLRTVIADGAFEPLRHRSQVNTLWPNPDGVNNGRTSI